MGLRMVTQPETVRNSRVIGSIKSPIATQNSLNPVFYAYPYAFGSETGKSQLKHPADKCSGDIEQLVDLAFNFEYKQTP